MSSTLPVLLSVSEDVAKLVDEDEACPDQYRMRSSPRRTTAHEHLEQQHSLVLVDSCSGAQYCDCVTDLSENTTQHSSC